MIKRFDTVKRNYGHWDIWQNDDQFHGRIYRIRGGPGNYEVIPDHIRRHEESQKFKTVQACMSYICDKLMFELIVAEGQDFDVIESWNID